MIEPIHQYRENPDEPGGPAIPLYSQHDMRIINKINELIDAFNTHYHTEDGVVHKQEIDLDQEGIEAIEGKKSDADV